MQAGRQVLPAPVDRARGLPSLPDAMPCMRTGKETQARRAHQRQQHTASSSAVTAIQDMPSNHTWRKNAVSTESIRLTPDEIAALTGYRRAAEQLAELKALGYWRARRNRLGEIVVERAHYQEVCAGTAKAPRSAGRAQPVLQ